jgi:hypothetical protein
MCACLTGRQVVRHADKSCSSREIEQDKRT